MELFLDFPAFSLGFLFFSRLAWLMKPAERLEPSAHQQSVD
jgi:hypothetical protein